MQRSTLWNVFGRMFFVLMCFLQVSSGYRILGVFPYVAKSHFVMAEELMKGLAARGHEVTVISHFPQKNPISNYKDISLVGSMPNIVSAVALDDIATGKVSTTINMLADLGILTCENTLSFPPVQTLIKSKEHFDLVINEAFNTDCFAPFAYIYKVPLVSISATPMLPWVYARFANPANPAYIGNIFLPHSDTMTFFERLVNTYYYLLTEYQYRYRFDKPSEEIARKYFADDSMPSLEQLSRNTSLILVNRHFSINQPIPNMPAVVEVGGIHVPIPKKLPQDLDKFLNESEHGVIVFSLGSIIRSDSFSTQKRDAFLEAFSELPQRVLWKWEADSLPGQPKNVKTMPWMPQGDVLAHPNVKAFITHGGLMGTMEAVYAGVPLVAVPVYGDQFHNVRNYVQEGNAVKLDYATITKENVLKALKTVLYNPSYSQRAKSVSEAFKDRPFTPLQTAVYWTEYVIRHGGAPHLRSAALDLTWYQYLLLDVVAVIAFVIISISLAVYLILNKIMSLFTRDASTKKEKTN